MCSTFYRERLGVLLGWYSEWTSCEQIITLCYLMSRISSVQAKFLSLFLASHPATADTRDVEIIEQEANSPNFLSGLHREPDEVVLSHLLSHLPLLKVDSHLARREYMNLLPKVLLGSCEHAHYLDQCWQLLCLSVLHPAFPPDDKNSLNYWLIRLREKSRAVEHKQQMLVMGGGVPPLPPQQMEEYHIHAQSHHLNPHGGYFPQIQPTLSSPGIPQHANCPTTGTGNFFPLLNVNPVSHIHSPVSPPAMDPIPISPHLPLQHSDSGIVVTEHGGLAAEYTRRGPPITPLLQGNMLWSPDKQQEGEYYPNAFRMSNDVMPQMNGFHHRSREHDNKAEPVFRSLSYPLVKKGNIESQSLPHEQTTDLSMHFDTCNNNTNSSSVSGSSGEYEVSGRQDGFVYGPGMQEVPNWLKSLRLHKYQDIFTHLSYKEMLCMDESKLEYENVTTGARHKILQSIQRLSSRHQLLNILDQDLDSMSSLCADSQELIDVILELKSVVMSPMPLYVPVISPPPPTNVSNNGTSFQLPQVSLKRDKRRDEKEFESSSTNETNPDQDKSIYKSRTESPSHLADGSVVGERTRSLLQSKVSDVTKEDLASMITIVTSKVFTKLMVLTDFEEDSMTNFLQTLEKGISHEAFSESQKALFAEWMTQLEQVLARNQVLRMNRAHPKKTDCRVLRARSSWSAGTQPVTQPSILNKGSKQWRPPNRHTTQHAPIHNAYLSPPCVMPGVQLPLTAVRSFPSVKYTNYIPIKTNINKAKSFPSPYLQNPTDYFTDPHPIDSACENGMLCHTPLSDRVKCGPPTTTDYVHVQTNDVYIESLCRSMTDHALGDSSSEGLANS